MKATRGVLERGYFLVFTGWHSILLPIKYIKKKFHMMQVKKNFAFLLSWNRVFYSHMPFTCTCSIPNRITAYKN